MEHIFDKNNGVTRNSIGNKLFGCGLGLYWFNLVIALKDFDLAKLESTGKVEKQQINTINFTHLHPKLVSAGVSTGEKKSYRNLAMCLDSCGKWSVFFLCCW